MPNCYQFAHIRYQGRWLFFKPTMMWDLNASFPGPKISWSSQWFRFFGLDLYGSVRGSDLVVLIFTSSVHCRDFSVRVIPDPFIQNGRVQTRPIRIESFKSGQNFVNTVKTCWKFIKKPKRNRRGFNFNSFIFIKNQIILYQQGVKGREGKKGSSNS